MAFDDDESPFVGKTVPNAAEDSMEDGLPDYKLFAGGMFEKKGVSSKNIRKGEKDFEPHGTRAQDNALEASRAALENVLSYTRTHRLDAWTRGWYFPDTWGPHAVDDNRDPWLEHRVVAVEHEKGSWMKDIGRTVTGVGRGQPGAGRLWLLPEEALWLVERGTLDLWWPEVSLQDVLPSVQTAPVCEGFGPDDYESGVPVSLQAAFALFVGYGTERGKITLPQYQVYAHLKRAGYIVLRAPPEVEAEAPPQPLPAPSQESGLWQWLFSLLSIPRKERASAPWGPLVSPGIYRAYGPIYRQLAVLPRHRAVAAPTRHTTNHEPFRICFHVWKPGGVPFSKKNPPRPDFRVAVTDTSDSMLPTLPQMEALLESTPLDPPGEAMQGPGRLYKRLKHGHRNVLIAVVDYGLVNFIRFGEAVFGDELLYTKFDSNGGGAGRGGKKNNRSRGRGGRGHGKRGG